MQQYKTLDGEQGQGFCSCLLCSMLPRILRPLANKIFKPKCKCSADRNLVAGNRFIQCPLLIPLLDASFSPAGWKLTHFFPAASQPSFSFLPLVSSWRGGVDGDISGGKWNSSASCCVRQCFPILKVACLVLPCRDFSFLDPFLPFLAGP